MKIRSWEKEGRTYYSTVIDADSVGHDLMWGSANFIRTAAKPFLSLVEQEPPADDDPQAGTDKPFDEPEDNDEDIPDGEDPAAAVFVVDNDGGMASLDLDTGELAQSGV